MLTKIVKDRPNAGFCRTAHGVRNSDAARVGESLQAGGDIDAIAVYRAVGLLDHLAYVHADAETQTAFVGDRLRRCSQLLLDGQRRRHRCGRQVENSEHRVSCHIDNASIVRLDMPAENGPGGIQGSHGGMLIESAARIAASLRLSSVPIAPGNPP